MVDGGVLEGPKTKDPFLHLHVESASPVDGLASGIQRPPGCQPDSNPKAAH